MESSLKAVWPQQMYLCSWEKATSVALALDMSRGFCFTLWLMILLHPGQPFTDVSERPEQESLNGRSANSLSLTLLDNLLPS